jgi:hypothetical protein
LESRARRNLIDDRGEAWNGQKTHEKQQQKPVHPFVKLQDQSIPKEKPEQSGNT